MPRPRVRSGPRPCIGLVEMGDAGKNRDRAGIGRLDQLFEHIAHLHGEVVLRKLVERAPPGQGRRDRVARGPAAGGILVIIGARLRLECREFAGSRGRSAPAAWTESADPASIGAARIAMAAIAPFDARGRCDGMSEFFLRDGGIAGHQRIRYALLGGRKRPVEHIADARAACAADRIAPALQPIDCGSGRLGKALMAPQSRYGYAWLGAASAALWPLALAMPRICGAAVRFRRHAGQAAQGCRRPPRLSDRSWCPTSTSWSFRARSRSTSKSPSRPEQKVTLNASRPRLRQGGAAGRGRRSGRRYSRRQCPDRQPAFSPCARSGPPHPRHLLFRQDLGPAGRHLLCRLRRAGRTQADADDAVRGDRRTAHVPGLGRAGVQGDLYAVGRPAVGVPRHLQHADRACRRPPGPARRK